MANGLRRHDHVWCTRRNGGIGPNGVRNGVIGGSFGKLVYFRSDAHPSAFVISGARLGLNASTKVVRRAKVGFDVCVPNISSSIGGRITHGYSGDARAERRGAIKEPVQNPNNDFIFGHVGAQFAGNCSPAVWLSCSRQETVWRISSRHQFTLKNSGEAA